MLESLTEVLLFSSGRILSSFFFFKMKCLLNVWETFSSVKVTNRWCDLYFAPYHVFRSQSIPPMWLNPGLWHKLVIKVLFDVFVCRACLNIQTLSVTFMCFEKHFESLYAFCFQSFDLAMFWGFFLKRLSAERSNSSVQRILYFLKEKQTLTSWKIKRRSLRPIMRISS